MGHHKGKNNNSSRNNDYKNEIHACPSDSSNGRTHRFFKERSKGANTPPALEANTPPALNFNTFINDLNLNVAGWNIRF
jgi:hypothetical protein